MSTLRLPTDRPRSAASSYQRAEAPFTLLPELTRNLTDLGRQEGVTLFMMLLAAFQLALSRYSGQEDIVVGTDVANRNHLETEGLIGFFINQLVLRTDLSGNPSVRELLRRVRETTLGAYDHQDVPFERLVEELSPERSLGRTPLFQVQVLLQNMPRQETSPNLTATAGSVSLNRKRFSLDNQIAKFDITLRIIQAHDILRGSLEYCSDLFTSGSMTWLLNLYQAVLNRLAEPSSLDSSIDTLMAAVERPLRSAKQEQQFEILGRGLRRERPRKVPRRIEGDLTMS
jgi:non-ribosomal peptide synthetase component F